MVGSSFANVQTLVILALGILAFGIDITAGIGFGKLAAPLRAALAGRTVTPSVYDMMLVIGREETIARLTDAVA